jgi:hypothetical protein
MSMSMQLQLKCEKSTSSFRAVPLWLWAQERQSNNCQNESLLDSQMSTC